MSAAELRGSRIRLLEFDDDNRLPRDVPGGCGRSNSGGVAERKWGVPVVAALSEF